MRTKKEIKVLRDAYLEEADKCKKDGCHKSAMRFIIQADTLNWVLNEEE